MHKRSLLCAVVAVALALPLCAQSFSDVPDRNALNRKVHSRVPQLNSTLLDRGLHKRAGALRSGRKDGTMRTLPADRWFPGEWEEVQAIFVGWPYEDYPADHAGNAMYWADPLVDDVADLYRWRNRTGWEYYETGRYVSVIDTSRHSADKLQVFAHVIDAIQQGGAEAWVCIRHAADSSVIKRYMARMGLPMTKYRWVVAPGNSIWYRDCGPICFYYGVEDSIGMLDFMYYPGRGHDDQLPVVLGEQMGWPVYSTDVEWEGGNCLVDGAGMTVSSDAVFATNGDTVGRIVWDGRDYMSIGYEYKAAMRSSQVRDSLSKLMNDRSTVILPALQYDGGTGHIDLYADMLDENSFVFSKYPQDYSLWMDNATASRNIDSLCSLTSIHDQTYRYRTIPFPRRDDGSNFGSEREYDSVYTRTYSNHTFVNKLIIQPCFSPVVDGMPTAEWDKENVEKLQRAYKGYKIYPIDVRSFDGWGGAIHCITKQIPADDPIRILHASIEGNTDSTYVGKDVELKLRATNRHGIGNVIVMYQFNGESYRHPIEMDRSETDSNEWTAKLPTASLPVEENGTRVEYFFQVTSARGKSITKPMTGYEGGTYTFYIGHHEEPVLGVGSAEHPLTVGEFYPNPAGTRTSVRIEVPQGEKVYVEVLDVQGRGLYQTAFVSTGAQVLGLDCSRFSRGIYMVRIATGNGPCVVRRLVRQ
ncbi:MAG: agmatine deiminase family protein [Bacteroidales bacterium]|nr:agmatine deiminase family protein [Bacteroidales bacterium]